MNHESHQPLLSHYYIKFFVFLEFDSCSPHTLQLYWQESPGYSSNIHLSTEERKSYGFAMTCGWINDARIVISVWTLPLKCICVWGKRSPPGSLTQGFSAGSFFSGGWICMTSSLWTYAPHVSVHVWLCVSERHLVANKKLSISFVYLYGAGCCFKLRPKWERNSGRSTAPLT